MHFPQFLFFLFFLFFLVSSGDSSCRFVFLVILFFIFIFLLKSTFSVLHGVISQVSLFMHVRSDPCEVIGQSTWNSQLLDMVMTRDETITIVTDSNSINLFRWMHQLKCKEEAWCVWLCLYALANGFQVFKIDWNDDQIPPRSKLSKSWASLHGVAFQLDAPTAGFVAVLSVTLSQDKRTSVYYMIYGMYTWR